MARLTRKFLTALGIEDENVQDQIIEGHTETTNALKAERDKYKEDAEALPNVQKELDDLKAEKGDGNKWEEKYKSLKAEYDNYKTDVEAKETLAKKRSAYKKLLKDAGVSDNRIDLVLKVSEFDKIEFDNEGKIKDADKMKKSIQEEWKEFISKTEKTGANTPTPPDGGDKGRTSGRASELYKQHMQEKFGTKFEEAK